MRNRSYLIILFVAALTVSSCGSADTQAVAETNDQPVETAAPAPETPAPPTSVAPEESCVAPTTDGPSVDDIRVELAKIREADSDAISQARESFGYFPDVPSPDSAEFTDYSISLTDIGDGNVSKSTLIIFESNGTIDDFFTFYRAEAEERGWTEVEALGAGSQARSLQTISFDIPDFPDTERAFSVKVFEGQGTTGRSEVELSIAVSGPGSELGEVSDWYTWHQAEVPMIENGCYESGGATTNAPVEGNFDSLGQPGDNLHVAATYEGISELEVKDKLRALGEESGFTASEESVNFVLTKDDLKIRYQIVAVETQTSKRATIKAEVNFTNP